MSRKRKAAILLTPIVVMLALIARPIWERICGNSPIAFYGKIVDDNGNGVAGVEVNFDILYSDQRAIPVPFGRVEKQRHESVTTDARGDFALKGVYGYSVYLTPAKYRGKEWGFASDNLKADDDPGYGVSMDDRFSRSKLPDAPAKRVKYRLVNLQ